MTNDATLLVPAHFVGDLVKIEVQQGDIPCTSIIAPPLVAVYVNKIKCVSKIHRNRKIEIFHLLYFYIIKTRSIHPPQFDIRLIIHQNKYI